MHRTERPPLIPTAAAEVPVRKIETLSPVYTVDREYRSMTGPSSAQTIEFPEKETPELLWVTAFRTRMVGADGVTFDAAIPHFALIAPAVES